MPRARTAAVRAAGLAVLLLAGWGTLVMGDRSRVTAPRAFVVLYAGLFVALVGGALLLFGPWTRRL